MLPPKPVVAALRRLLGACAASIVGTLVAASALAQPAPAPAASGPAAAASAPARAASAPPIPPGTYSEKGADTCLKCHDEEADTLTFTTAGVFRNAHAHRGDKRAPFGPGGLQCEACHGPAAQHARDGKEVHTLNSLKANSKRTIAERNEPCLGCHQSRARTGWHAGAHAREQLACADCHKLHVARDPVLAKATEPDVCYTCHKKQRADFVKTSSHPLKFGRMSCSDCHNAHGSGAAATLNKPSINQTCTSCHADKRGPVLWEHAPVAEDCTLCHTSHGSVRHALLNKTPPLLCQQCHTVAGHPAVARTGALLPGGGAAPSIFLLAGGCTNCHSQVHGSNHPAGAKLMR
ncbi:MAG: DmsE family decaheme c-type cytochrome [Burkholderiaceae bacterium]